MKNFILQAILCLVITNQAISQDFDVSISPEEFEIEKALSVYPVHVESEDSYFIPYTDRSSLTYFVNTINLLKIKKDLSTVDFIEVDFEKSRANLQFIEINNSLYLSYHEKGVKFQRFLYLQKIDLDGGLTEEKIKLFEYEEQMMGTPLIVKHVESPDKKSHLFVTVNTLFNKNHPVELVITDSSLKETSRRVIKYPEEISKISAENFTLANNGDILLKIVNTKGLGRKRDLHFIVKSNDTQVIPTSSTENKEVYSSDILTDENYFTVVSLLRGENDSKSLQMQSDLYSKDDLSVVSTNEIQLRLSENVTSDFDYGSIPTLVINNDVPIYAFKDINQFQMPIGSRTEYQTSNRNTMIIEGEKVVEIDKFIFSSSPLPPTQYQVQLDFILDHHFTIKNSPHFLYNAHSAGKSPKLGFGKKSNMKKLSTYLARYKDGKLTKKKVSKIGEDYLILTNNVINLEENKLLFLAKTKTKGKDYKVGIIEINE